MTVSTFVFPGALEFIRQQVEKVVHPQPPYLPDELVLSIFSYLTPEDLGRASRVCRDWRKLTSDDLLWNAFDLDKIFPGSIMSESYWKIRAKDNDPPVPAKRVYITRVKILFCNFSLPH